MFLQICRCFFGGHYHQSLHIKLTSHTTFTSCSYSLIAFVASSLLPSLHLFRPQQVFLNMAAMKVQRPSWIQIISSRQIFTLIGEISHAWAHLSGFQLTEMKELKRTTIHLKTLSRSLGPGIPDNSSVYVHLGTSFVCRNRLYDITPTKNAQLLLQNITVANNRCDFRLLLFWKRYYVTFYILFMYCVTFYIVISFYKYLRID